MIDRIFNKYYFTDPMREPFKWLLLFWSTILIEMVLAIKELAVEAYEIVNERITRREIETAAIKEEE